jgi:hypothetical protein
VKSRDVPSPSPASWLSVIVLLRLRNDPTSFFSAKGQAGVCHHPDQRPGFTRLQLKKDSLPGRQITACAHALPGQGRVQSRPRTLTFPVLLTLSSLCLSCPNCTVSRGQTVTLLCSEIKGPEEARSSFCGRDFLTSVLATQSQQAEKAIRALQKSEPLSGADAEAPAWM